MIHLKDISIGYNEELLAVTDLKLNSGGVYALIGANGSGKSTLLHTILGIKKPLKGKIELNGVNIGELQKSKISQTIAFVESSFAGVEFLSVHDYVGLGRTPYLDALGRLKPADNEIISSTLEQMGMEKFAARETTQLSDGERQKTAIARAMAQTTPIILMDEPTAFLDYGNRKLLIQLLVRLAREENKCIVFSTHDIDLCLDEDLSLLVIDQQDHELKLISPGISKEDLLRIGFNI